MTCIDESSNPQSVEVQIVVIRPQNFVDTIFPIYIFLMIVSLNTLFGTEVSVSNLRFILSNPKPLVTAAICQFVFLPPVSYAKIVSDLNTVYSEILFNLAQRFKNKKRGSSSWLLRKGQYPTQGFSKTSISATNLVIITTNPAKTYCKTRSRSLAVRWLFPATDLLCRLSCPRMMEI